MKSDLLMRTVVRNSAWSTFAVIASPILQFLFGGLTLRYVGIDAAGFSFSVAAALGIAARFGTCGIGEASLPSLAAAFSSGDDEKARRLVGAVLAVFAFSGVLTATAMFASANLFIEWAQASIELGTAKSFITLSCFTHVLAQVRLALHTILRAGGRYDIVTAVTTPLSLATGIVACILVPLFPSLMTVALVNLAAAAIGILFSLWALVAAIPIVRRPLLGLGELPSLGRYGFWLMLTHALGALTAGVDDLVIAGTCGAAAVPPWAIGKRLWLTAHTFLAQHTEHLIPTLGGLKHAPGRDAGKSLIMPMHWYVVLMAASGYTLMASWGTLIVRIVAGADVADLCAPAIISYSLLGIGYAVLIIPVVAALASGVSRPSFIVAVLANTAQLGALWLSAINLGAPAIYYAPIAALPLLLLATGTSSTSIFSVSHSWHYVRPILVPALCGFAGIWLCQGMSLSSMRDRQQFVLGIVLAAGVLGVTIAVENLLSVNKPFHRQLSRVVSFGCTAVTGFLRVPSRLRRTTVGDHE